MTHEPLVAPSQPAPVEPAVKLTHDGSEQPAPTEQQQQVADDVFSKEQGQIAAALLAAQTGLGLVHNLIVDTFGKPAQKTVPPERQPRPDEEEEQH
jgi:hypothetical protein